MKRVILCADDYHIAPGVSKAIRELIAKGRLNATSVMTIFPGLREEAQALANTPSPTPVEIGLHLTLSGGFAPLVSPPLIARDGKLPDIRTLLSPASYFRVSEQAIALEIEAQIEAFESAFGRTPDFIDGHQHCQLMPGVQKTFLATIARRAPKSWVRQCAPASASTLLSADNKTRVIGALSLNFKRLAHKYGVPVNPSFSGAYDYEGREKFEDLLPRFLRELTDGGVMMCHPGFVDEVLCSRDFLRSRREEEHSLLLSDRFIGILKDAGATLA